MPTSLSNTRILNELERILASSDFEASQRNKNFLRYVVGEALAGRADRIKAYTVATSVFGRGDNFDPLQDSIVRIEAGRLRRALEHFYLKNSVETPVRIGIPKGTYVPEFFTSDQHEEKSAPPTEVPPAILHTLGPKILVRGFEQSGDCSRFPNLGRRLTMQVISALMRFTEIFVYGFETSDMIAQGKSDESEVSGLIYDYELLATVTSTDVSMTAEFLLRSPSTGRFLWAFEEHRSFGDDPNPAEIREMCAAIAGQVARVIAQRDGILDSQARDSSGKDARNFAGYQILLDFQDYWRSLDPELFEPLRYELEKTIAEDPQFSDGFACLSMLYSNAARYGIDVQKVCFDPMHRALDLARTAIRLAPSSSRAYHAKAIAEWFSGMPELSLTSLNHARSLNPNDAELLAEQGFRLAMRMRWDEAVPLIEESYIRNPLQVGAYRMGLFLYHFAEERYQEAYDSALATEAPKIAVVHIAAAVALHGLDRLDDAMQELREAERLSPGLRSRLEKDLRFRQIHPDLIDKIVTAVGSIERQGRPDVRPALA